MSGDSAIFIQRVLPGSTAATYDLLGSGDQILAIDGQLLDGADFLMYLHIIIKCSLIV